MAYILFILFITFVVVPIAKIAYRIWMAQRQYRRFVDDMMGGSRGASPFGSDTFGRGARTSGYDKKTTGRHSHPAHGKRIAHDVGEYVAFTEISTTEDYSKTTGSTGRVRVESQISDAEWIDIE